MMDFKDSPCAKCPRQAAMAEALRHADIDLSMLLPLIEDRHMGKLVRGTLAMIDAALTHADSNAIENTEGDASGTNRKPDAQNAYKTT